MSAEEPVREGGFGWVRVALVVLVSAAGPVWAMWTAVVIQLSPDLNGTAQAVAEGTTEIAPIPWSAFVIAGAQVAWWMLLLSPAVLGVIALARLGWAAARLRADATRDRYDQMVADDAVIDDPAWRDPDPTPPAE